MGQATMQQHHQQQQPTSSSDNTTHEIVLVSSQVSTSPESFQLQESQRVQQRPMSAAVAQLTGTLKQMEQKQLHSTASSPKTIFSERESPSHGDEWSDGSTTVNIPGSPTRSDEEDLDQMMLSNQFKTMHDNYANMTPNKMGSGVKREAEHHPHTPKSKKSKQ